MTKKVLIVAHGHPDHRPGGGEIAAYNLHQQLLAADGFDSVFFARHEDPELTHGGSVFSGNNNPQEVLFYATMPDWFRFSQPDKATVWRDFQQVLENYQPDIVHFHHYLFMGLEFFRQVKNHNPDISIVLTLHEYMGICHNQGQMVRKDTGELCSRARHSDCAACFPEYTAQDFFLRERFIKSHFELVDHFVSPSTFLADRYIQWGLPAERFSVVENMLNSNESPALRQETKHEYKIRLVFFGQINKFKGVDLLLDAIKLLPDPVRQQIQLDINGSGLQNQSAKLRNSIARAIKAYPGVIQLHGRYHQSELKSLMSMSDWVVVPSIWWENSPVVILEARKYGVPVLCSDIGGMAEKVIDGKTGLHFMARRAESLARQITWIVDNPHRREEFSRNMAASFDGDESLAQHEHLYRSLVDGTRNKVELRVA